MAHSLVRLATLVALSLFVVACGNRPQVITGVKVQSSTVDQDLHLAVSAEVDLGNMSFPAVSLPILHPRGQTPIGSVELNPVLGGKNQIKVNVNLSELSDIEARPANLPNGNSIPLIAQNPVIEVSLGAGAKLYIAASQTVTAIGVAIPIKTFDQIGQNVGGVNLFPVFNIDQVQGAAGIFTSRNAGQNGFALVMDVSNYVRMQDVYVPALVQAQEASDDLQLNYSEQIPDRAKENKINSMILNLNRQAKRLQLR